jgi:hypothetical protein
MHEERKKSFKRAKRKPEKKAEGRRNGDKR